MPHPNFKSTDSGVELSGNEVLLRSATEDCLAALVQVLEEKLVRRKVSLKALDLGKVEEASKGNGAPDDHLEGRDHR